jgi:hypothetical protein
MVAMNRDSIGVTALHKAYEMDKTRVDLLLDIGTSYFNKKMYNEAAAAFTEKIQAGRDVKAMDIFMLGKSYYFAHRFMEADSVFNKLCEIQPKWPSAFLWNADNKTQIDTNSKEGLAKPLYEKYIELVLADSVNKAKYTETLKRAYGYLASYYLLQKKDYTNSLVYLRKKLELAIDPEERKLISQQIEQEEKEMKK